MIMTCKIEIEDIKRINVKPGECLIVTVDIGVVPKDRMKHLFDHIKEVVRAHLPDDVKVMVVTSNVKFEVVSADRTLKETGW